MPIVHAKSQCCRGIIRRFGGRRRQCATCSKTWRIRYRKRGPSQLRIDSKLAIKYICGDLLPLSRVAKKRKISPQCFQYRFQHSLDVLLSQSSWPALPSKVPLIAIADGLIQVIEGKIFTLFVILLRPVNSHRAIICEPYLAPGHESPPNWRLAFGRLPKYWQNRILALICDGRIELLSLAKSRGWVTQRCHAHLKRRIQQYVSKGPLSRNRDEGQKVQGLVEIILKERNKLKMVQTMLKLQEKLKSMKSRNLRRTISGFLKHVPQYRSYLEHPELNLPATTNSVESVNGVIREVLRRARGFRTRRSFLRWVTAVLITKRYIACKGKNSTKTFC